MHGSFNLALLAASTPNWARWSSFQALCAKETMNPCVRASNALILSFLLTLSGCGGNSDEPRRRKKELFDTSVEAVHSMFAENQIGGAQFFQSRAAVLTGEVMRVREALGVGILAFRSDESGMTTELAFSGEAAASLGELRSGSRVRVTCPVIEEFMGQVFFVCAGVDVLHEENSNDD
jgi:hypothetical protein